MQSIWPCLDLERACSSMLLASGLRERSANPARECSVARREFNECTTTSRAATALLLLLLQYKAPSYCSSLPWYSSSCTRAPTHFPRPRLETRSKHSFYHEKWFKVFVEKWLIFLPRIISCLHCFTIDWTQTFPRQCWTQGGERRNLTRLETRWKSYKVNGWGGILQG